MARTQLNVRVPETTLSQIEELQRLGYESQSHTIIIAIDRLYAQEKNMNSYKGFRIEVFQPDSNFGGKSNFWTWTATDTKDDSALTAWHGHGDNLTREYKSEADAIRAAKQSINALLDKGY